MERMIEKQTNPMSSLCKTSPAAAAGLGIHRTSTQLVITKVKPKIRIIHIFAPEIIKTDVANFRELVQRLTGKPNSESKGVKRKGRGTDNPFPTKRAAVAATGELTKKKMELSSSWEYYRDRVSKLEMADDQEMMMMMSQKMNGSNNSGGGGGGGYLGQFADLDGLMQELNCNQFFPLFPTETASNSSDQVDSAVLAGRSH
ncbi:VQ motif-containing protein 25 [Impatiens glandulifera]|uniref:VQ motif-containing protein 25 n=1 Tax=Impatiens glandulifera TaxID=253017 RepID=UPI001FB14301|nr:VQ motif-containing protein 25 [Impatiens glandulifera]